MRPSPQQIRALRVIERQQHSGDAGHDCEGDLSMCSRNWPATHHALVRRGLVETTFHDGDDSPWTYRLTSAARAILREEDDAEWNREVEAERRHLRELTT